MFMATTNTATQTPTGADTMTAAAPIALIPTRTAPHATTAAALAAWEAGGAFIIRGFGAPVTRHQLVPGTPVRLFSANGSSVVAVAGAGR